MKFLINKNVLQASFIALNFVFALLSVSLIGLGIVYNDDLSLVEMYITRITFLQLPVLLIILGALSFLSTLIGCYFIRYYNQKYLCVYIAFLTLLLAAELTVACLAFLNIYGTHVDNTRSEMQQLLNNTEAKTEFYQTEEHFRCCGVEGIEEYECDDMVLHDGTLCDKVFNYVSRMPVTGCAITITNEIIQMSWEIGGYLSIYAIIQIIDITCLLMILIHARAY